MPETKSLQDQLDALCPSPFEKLENVLKRNAIKFLLAYNESDYCMDEDETFFLDTNPNSVNITIEELYDRLMTTKK